MGNLLNEIFFPNSKIDFFRFLHGVLFKSGHHLSREFDFKLLIIFQIPINDTIAFSKTNAQPSTSTENLLKDDKNYANNSQVYCDYQIESKPIVLSEVEVKDVEDIEQIEEKNDLKPQEQQNLGHNYIFPLEQQSNNFYKSYNQRQTKLAQISQWPANEKKNSAVKESNHFSIHESFKQPNPVHILPHQQRLNKFNSTYNHQEKRPHLQRSNTAPFQPMDQSFLWQQPNNFSNLTHRLDQDLFLMNKINHPQQQPFYLHESNFFQSTNINQIDINQIELEKSFGYNTNNWQSYQSSFFIPQDQKSQFNSLEYVPLNRNQQKSSPFQSLQKPLQSLQKFANSFKKS